MDRIDLKILQLLQQRTKLSGRIGQAKRRHRAVIYVPERERELVACLLRRSRGKLPPRAVTAIFREIISSSRAAQGQAPVGLLQSSAKTLLLPGRWWLGACDEFSPRRTWPELAKGLETGALALVLLTGADLARALRTMPRRKQFFQEFTVTGDFSSAADGKGTLAERVFIVTPKGKGAAWVANRILILIKCKSTVNAVKSLLNSMPDRPLHAEQLAIQAPQGREGLAVSLVRLTLAKSTDGLRATSHLLTARELAGLRLSILGVYPSPEDYGG